MPLVIWYHSFDSNSQGTSAHEMSARGTYMCSRDDCSCDVCSLGCLLEWCLFICSLECLLEWCLCLSAHYDVCSYDAHVLYRRLDVILYLLLACLFMECLLIMMSAHVMYVHVTSAHVISAHEMYDYMMSTMRCLLMWCLQMWYLSGHMIPAHVIPFCFPFAHVIPAQCAHVRDTFTCFTW